MIITVKPGKLKKVNQEIFKLISVSTEPIDTGDASITVFNMTDLLPTADMFMKYYNGQLSKKKFIKKYSELIKTKNGNIEYALFSIGMALKNRASICLTCNEKEYKIGYIKVLAEYIGDLFGVDVKELDDANETISFELDSYSKKERKLLKKSDDDLSNKQIKLKNKIAKSINKSVSEGICNKDTYEKMDRKFAIDQIAMVLITPGAVKIDKKNNRFKDINTELIPKTKPYITALFIASDESKAVKKICKSVFESHQLKFKEKTCKKMDTVTFITLFGEIYGKILAYRCGDSEK